jgi:hypothetical protein
LRVSRAASPGAAASAGKLERGIESAVHAKRRGQEEEHDDEDGDGDDDGGDDGSAGTAAHRAKLDRSDTDWLDPSARHAAQLAPPGIALAPASPESMSASATESVRARSLEELLPALVRKIAWAGDRNKGTVRLELGAGAYAGTTVTVHADGGRVRVELGGSEGPDLDRLRTRLDARLRGHGLDVESVT